MTASETRRQAREFLKTLTGKYQLFIVTIILSILTISLSYRQTIVSYGDVTIFVDFSTSLPPLIQILLTLFLASASYAVLDVLRAKRTEVSVSDNMIVFSNELFWKFLVTAIVKWFFIFLWSLIAIAGGVILSLGMIVSVDNNLAGSAIIFVGCAMALIGTFFAIMKQYAYSMTTYVLYDEVNNGTYRGPRQVIAKSQALMDGNKWRFFCLEFSFIGWDILTALTFGLLCFYTLPYRTIANLIFYENLLEQEEI